MALLEWLPILVTAVVLWAAAGWLLWLNPRSAATRAIALLLALRGMTTFLVLPVFETGAILQPGPRVILAAGSALGLSLSAVYFVAVYPRRRGWLGVGRWGWIVLSGGWLVVLAAIVAPAAANGYATGRGDVFDGLSLWTHNYFAVLGVLSAVLAWDALRATSASDRGSHFLVFLAFGLDVM